MEPKPRVPHHRDDRLGARAAPFEFPWLMAGEVDALAIRLVEQLQIQP